MKHSSFFSILCCYDKEGFKVIIITRRVRYVLSKEMKAGLMDIPLALPYDLISNLNANLADWTHQSVSYPIAILLTSPSCLNHYDSLPIYDYSLQVYHPYKARSLESKLYLSHMETRVPNGLLYHKVYLLYTVRIMYICNHTIILKVKE